MSEWPQNEHVATAWAGATALGQRMGTMYIYEHHLDEYRNSKGFRLRPKYLKWMNDVKGEKIIEAQAGGFKFDLRLFKETVEG